jgi:hypothetical protein
MKRLLDFDQRMKEISCLEAGLVRVVLVGGKVEWEEAA